MCRQARRTWPFSISARANTISSPMADFFGPSCMLLIIVSSLAMFGPEHRIVLAETGVAAHANREKMLRMMPASSFKPPQEKK